MNKKELDQTSTKTLNKNKIINKLSIFLVISIIINLLLSILSIYIYMTQFKQIEKNYYYGTIDVVIPENYGIKKYKLTLIDDNGNIHEIKDIKSETYSTFSTKQIIISHITINESILNTNNNIKLNVEYDIKTNTNNIIKKSIFSTFPITIKNNIIKFNTILNSYNENTKSHYSYWNFETNITMKFYLKNHFTYKG